MAIIIGQSSMLDPSAGLPQGRCELLVESGFGASSGPSVVPVVEVVAGPPALHRTTGALSTPHPHGTTTLFAALEVATGRVQQACLPRHRHHEFLRLLKQVAKAFPRIKLHLVVDTYATYKHPAVTAGLARNPRITLHVTPRSGFWLNMVEIFFSISPAKPSAAAATAASRTSSPRSEASSTAGTTAANPSPGPRPPTRSSAEQPAVKDHHSRDTSEVD
jgi:hypothetical protein